MQIPLKRHCVFRILFGIFVFLGLHMPLKAVQPYEPNIVDPLLEPWRWNHIELLDGLGFQCLAQEPNETMWFGLKESVIRHDGLHWRRFGLADGLTPLTKWILAMPDGSIYLQTSKAIHLFQDHQWITVQTRTYSGVPSQSMTADDQGRVWAACDEGLISIENGTARLVKSIEGGVTTVCIDSQKQLWYLAHNFKTVYVAPLLPANPSGLGETRPIHLYSRDRARQGCILEASDGRLWIASDASGDPVHIFDPTKQTWAQIDLSTTLGRYTCTAMAQTQDGTVWLIGQGRLYAYQHGKQRTYNAPELKFLPRHQLF